MLKQTLTLIICACLPILLFGQPNRTLDGTNNNQSNPTWGAAGEQLPRMVPAAYADGISLPGGIGLPNPRIISNALFAQDSLIHDQMNLSDFVWVFGQFLDHDITQVGNDPTEPIPIPVDFPDEYFNPGGGFPDVVINMHRSMAASGTGTDVTNPRQHDNLITSWIDASNVYGSDVDRASWLRTFVDGKLKTSSGNLLPYNTTDGEFGSPIDLNAPFMDNENPFVTKLFVAGDSRANENTLLTAFHTLFVREHNRLCDELQSDNPAWTDEKLYQEARRRVIAHIQAITYEEWLPAMGISLPTYNGYDASLNPTITNVFSAAAFRLGHTLLNPNLRMVDDMGNYLGTIALKDAFFTPAILANNGMEVFLKGMAEQVEQELDAKVVDDVRNFLFGPPTAGLGGLDLAAININRGRERGIPSFNAVRINLGLSPYSGLNDFSSNTDIAAILASLYGNVNNIDAWVGMLLEDHMPDMLFGETIMYIMMQQFGDLRDGDRYFYEIDYEMTADEIAAIKATPFSEVIMRNTGVTIMQENVFEAMPHDSISTCSAAGPYSDISGGIQTYSGLNMSEVEVSAINSTDNTTLSTLTGSNGGYLLENATSCDNYLLTPYKNSFHVNGVTTFDLIKISNHILELELLNSPYKIIAADANNDGNVTTLDIVALRKLILFIDTELANNTSWRFVDANYAFNDPTQPLDEVFPESIEVTEITENNGLQNFVGLKIGDVNGNANPDLFGGDEGGDTRTGELLVFKAPNQRLRAGERIQIPIYADDIAEMRGFQFTLQADPGALVFDGVIPQQLPSLSENSFNYLSENGLLLASWDGDADDLSGKELLFTLKFEVLKDGLLSDFVELNSSKITAESYFKNHSMGGAVLRFEEKNNNTITSELVVHQNQPNPFKEETVIGFELPGASEVTLRIMDTTGKLLHQSTGPYTKGYQQFTVARSDFAPAGPVLFYELETAFGTATRKMVTHK